MTIGALAFLNPWLLAALASLPVIYWLLRTVPPRPRQIEFPPTRILVGIESPEKQPAKTPWWLMLIRLLAAALVILALAEPILNPRAGTALKGTGPVAVVVDNGWSAAPRWSERLATVERIIGEAEAQRRPAVVVPTANAAKTITAKIGAPSAARSSAAALSPQPFAPDRTATAAALETALANTTDASILWLADGIDHKGEAREFAQRLVALARGGTVAIVEPRGTGLEALGVRGGVGRDGRLEAAILRAEGGIREGVVHAFSVRGQRLGETPFKFAGGQTQASVTFDLPLELRNQVTRIEIAGERSAGAVGLLDARAQWQRVGLVSGETREQAQPLLAPFYYIEKALAPFAEIVRATDSNVAAGIDTVLKRGATVLILADIGKLTGEVKDRVDAWVRKGGVLVRFAGPRLEKGSDELLPVPLRIGGRTLGGALSWSQPQPLTAFDAASLFAGLAIPPDVLVNRQVLADPARLGAETGVWARLKDGTPLVTAGRRGQGQLVLFHVTANSDWSNLPMSGLFVEMLQRIATLGRPGAGGETGDTAVAGTAGNGTEVLPPVQTLDGFGLLKPPPPTAQPVAADRIVDLVPSAEHPPGYYGAAGTPRSLNVLGPKTTLSPLPALPQGISRVSYADDTSKALKPWLLGVALMLIFADIVAVLVLQGIGMLLPRRRRAVVTAALALAALGTGLMLVATDASAQARREVAPPSRPTAPAGAVKRDDATALKATSKVTLGYVLTGDPVSDETSRQGLMGLGTILKIRTAVEPGAPIGVNVETEEIGFFPVLYWPVVARSKPLDEATLARIDAYMKQGGLIIFDTRDQGSGLPTGFTMPGQDGTALQRLLGRLDLPRLEPVPQDHVLTKAFYLLRTFPGRWDGGQMWVEAASENGSDDNRRARRADGVTSVIVTANDFASAWALDERGRPLYPVSPGGETQREMAFRTGINIVMHALTGNYKADQVHVPALLERLGQ